MKIIFRRCEQEKCWEAEVVRPKESSSYYYGNTYKEARRNTMSQLGITLDEKGFPLQHVIEYFEGVI
jgi:predicted RNase H-like HicB family nuclease